MEILALAMAIVKMAATANAALQTKVVECKHGDTVLEGYLAWDDAVNGHRPAVLVVHDWMRLGDYAKQRATKLAEMVYLAFAVDTYGKSIRPKTPSEAVAQAGIYKKDRSPE
jgi:dienelactone hydrolase